MVGFDIKQCARRRCGSRTRVRVAHEADGRVVEPQVFGKGSCSTVVLAEKMASFVIDEEVCACGYDAACAGLANTLLKTIDQVVVVGGGRTVRDRSFRHAPTVVIGEADSAVAGQVAGGI